MKSTMTLFAFLIRTSGLIVHDSSVHIIPNRKKHQKPLTWMPLKRLSFSSDVTKIFYFFKHLALFKNAPFVEYVVL